MKQYHGEMTASERVAALFAGGPIDRLPVIEWAPWWHLTYNRWIGEGMQGGDLIPVQRAFGLDGCHQWWIAPRTGATPQPASFGAGVMENEEDYERIKPTLYPEPASVFSDDSVRYLKGLHQSGESIFFLEVDGCFWYPRTLLGIEPHLYSFYDEPELLHHMLSDYEAWLYRLFDYVFSRVKPDFFVFGEDMSYNGGPMIGKESFDEFLAPYYRRLIPYVHSAGIPVIIDSDGDITKAVDWYGSVGADGMLPLERQAGVDVSLYIEKQPHMTFIGHFDKMCMKFGKDAMRREFERLLPSMRTGHLIPSVDHQTPPDVPLAYYRDYVSLLKEYAVRAVQDT